jgi:hypothetical protein
VLEEQPHVGRNLVVAAAGGMQLRRGGHAQGQRVLDVHVDVLEPLVPDEAAGLDVHEDRRIKPRVDGVPLLRRDEPDMGQHRGMGLASRDVEGRQPPVKRRGLAEFHHQRGGARFKAAPPGCLCFLGHVTGDEMTRRRAQAQREISPPFSSLPTAGRRSRFTGVRRQLTPVTLAFLLAAAPLRADESLARFNVVDIKPAVVSIFIATVTMAMPPFVRKGATYSSTYSAKVFPYFFYNEKGRIWIVVPDDLLRRAAKGQPVDFIGHATQRLG